MTREELEKSYFNWMYELVCGDSNYTKLSYKKLFKFLHNTEFIYFVEYDDNRAQDGIDFRYHFGYENGYSEEEIEMYLGNEPCSVLEMMVAMAFRGEEQIMDDYNYGNRTGQWFWNMLANLDLINMSDLRFDINRAENIIYRFLNREYEPDGSGGLFTIENTEYDLRYVDIWTQFMWYLDEVLEKEKN